MDIGSNLFRNYVIFFTDGTVKKFYGVAISSKYENRNVFIDEQGRTVFVVPDSSVKYIADEDLI